MTFGYKSNQITLTLTLITIKHMQQMSHGLFKIGSENQKISNTNVIYNEDLTQI